MKTGLSLCFVLLFSIFSSVKMTEKELSSIYINDKDLKPQSYESAKSEAKKKLTKFIINQQKINQNISRAKENIQTIKFSQSN